MFGSFIHWFNVEIWGSMWPNIFAPSFFTLVAVIVGYVKTHRHINKKHAEAKAHVADLLDPNTPGGLGDINVQTSTKS